MISFRNDAEAQRHAALTRPYQLGCAPLEGGYAARYGARAARAAQACKTAQATGDVTSLHIHQHALSLVLFADQPQLFSPRSRT